MHTRTCYRTQSRSPQIVRKDDVIERRLRNPGGLPTIEFRWDDCTALVVQTLTQIGRMPLDVAQPASRDAIYDMANILGEAGFNIKV